MTQVLNWKVALILALLFAINVTIGTQRSTRTPQSEQGSHVIMEHMGLSAGH